MIALPRPRVAVDSLPENVRLTKKRKAGRIEFYCPQFRSPLAVLTLVPGGWVLSQLGEIKACLPHWQESDAIAEATRRILAP